MVQEATYRPDGLHGAEAGLLYLLDGGILLLRELLVGGLQLLHLGLEGVLGSAELLLLLRGPLHSPHRARGAETVIASVMT